MTRKVWMRRCDDVLLSFPESWCIERDFADLRRGKGGQFLLAVE